MDATGNDYSLAIVVSTPLRELGPLYAAYQPPAMNAHQTATFNFSERILTTISGYPAKELRTAGYLSEQKFVQ